MMKNTNNAANLSYVNSHREATGHAPIASDVSDAELQRHLQLIDECAPYGDDPWADDAD